MPRGGDDLVNQQVLGGGLRAVFVAEGLGEVVEVGLGSMGITWCWAVRPCLKALADDRDLPWVVRGPVLN